MRATRLLTAVCCALLAIFLLGASGAEARNTASSVGKANFAIGVGQAELTGLQEALAAKGYLKGAATGTMDSRTTAAIKLYQKSAGLPVTGDADFDLLQHVTFGGLAYSGNPGNAGSSTGTSGPAKPRKTAPKPDAYVRMAQEMLKTQGLYMGALDGVSGAKTVEAVSLFESTNGLPPTGKVTPDLIRRLSIATGTPANTPAGTSAGGSAKVPGDGTTSPNLQSDPMPPAGTGSGEKPIEDMSVPARPGDVAPASDGRV